MWVCAFPSFLLINSCRMAEYDVLYLLMVHPDSFPFSVVIKVDRVYSIEPSDSLQPGLLLVKHLLADHVVVFDERVFILLILIYDVKQ